MKWKISILLALALNFHRATQNDSYAYDKTAAGALNQPTTTSTPNRDDVKNKTFSKNDSTPTQITITSPTTIITIQTYPETMNETLPSTATILLDTTSLPTTQQLNSWTNNCKVTKTALGIMVGLLVVVLAIVMTGWGWTCWLLKRRKINPKIHSERRVYSAHNRTYMQRISLESNSEQLSQQNSINHTVRNNSNHYCHRLEEVEEAGDPENQQENVYHILENPTGDDVYEVLDKYEQEEQPQDQEEENVYHILDGPTVVIEGEEEPGGVATPPSSDITVTVEDYEVAILQTTT